MQILNSVCLEILQLFQLCFAKKQRHNLKAPSEQLKRNAHFVKLGTTKQRRNSMCCAHKEKSRWG
jgi:hypothetical protein